MVSDRSWDTQDRVLCTRIVDEYLEMPGLNVTVPQACRLWSTDRTQCTKLFDTLLDSGFLRKSGDRYARADRSRRAA